VLVSLPKQRELQLTSSPHCCRCATYGPPTRARSSSTANNVHVEIVEREFGGAIRRGKGPLRLKANPLHRKAERAVQAFS